MASKQRHVDQWVHNRTFIELISPGFNDWIVTASFYTALHAVDTLLAHQGDAVCDHSSRNGILSQVNTYEKIWKHYRPLFEISRSVRYFANPSVWIPYADIETQIFKRNLYPIEKSVLKITGVELDLKPIRLAPAS